MSPLKLPRMRIRVALVSGQPEWRATVGIYTLVSTSFLNNVAMPNLPTDRAALDDYMGIWFRGEVPDTVTLVGVRHG
ncbi:hypothetical protein Tco_1432831 [Tanacetum coccineum]